MINNDNEKLVDILTSMFIKENVKVDSYLQSHLTSDLKIPLDAIYNVNTITILLKYSFVRN